MHCLVLTADYGAGHRSAAEALATALRASPGRQITAAVCNPSHAPGAPALLRRSEAAYLELAARAPERYGWAYSHGEQALVCAALMRLAALVGRPILRRLLAAERPDVVLCTFPLLAAAVANSLPVGQTPPTLTVATDLGPLHRLWFSGPGPWTVASPLGVASGLRAGAAPEQLHLTGVPIHPAYGDRPDLAAARQALGLAPERPTVLITGGGAGAASAEALALALDRAGLDLQLAVATGRNAALAERLRAHSWRVPARIFGSLPNLAAAMQAADLVLAKAGGLTLSEALAVGRPLVLYDALPGQEQGNLGYLCEQGAACAALDPETACGAVSRLLNDGQLRGRMAQRAATLGRPHAARAVADLALDLCRPHRSPTAQLSYAATEYSLRATG